MIAGPSPIPSRSVSILGLLLLVSPPGSSASIASIDVKSRLLNEYSIIK